MVSLINFKIVDEELGDSAGAARDGRLDRRESQLESQQKEIETHERSRENAKGRELLGANASDESSETINSSIQILHQNRTTTSTSKQSPNQTITSNASAIVKVIDGHESPTPRLAATEAAMLTMPIGVSPPPTGVNTLRSSKRAQHQDAKSTSALSIYNIKAPVSLCFANKHQPEGSSGFGPELQAAPTSRKLPTPSAQSNFVVTWRKLFYVIEPKWHQRLIPSLNFNMRTGEPSSSHETIEQANGNMTNKTTTTRPTDDSSILETGECHVHRLQLQQSGARTNKGTSNSDRSLQSASKIVLDRLDGSFKSGELTAILGPSGAGKTTLLDCLTGHKRSGLSGSVRISGSPFVPLTCRGDSPSDAMDLNLNRKKHKLDEVPIGSGELAGQERNLRVSIIPQNDHLMGHLTVYETLNYASKMKNCFNSQFNHKSNIKRIGQQLGLMSCLETRVNKLSGGQYKRVSIAQELLSNPDVLILDEPTSGLDAMTCYQTVQVLRKLTEPDLETNPAEPEKSHRQMAVILTIHQPNSDVFQQFNHVYVVAQGGKCIFEGPPSNIESVINRIGIRVPSRSYNPATLIVEVAAAKFGLEAIDKLNCIQRKQYDFQASPSTDEQTSTGDSAVECPSSSCSFSFGNETEDEDSDQDQDGGPSEADEDDNDEPDPNNNLGASPGAGLVNPAFELGDSLSHNTKNHQVKDHHQLAQINYKQIEMDSSNYLVVGQHTNRIDSIEKLKSLGRRRARREERKSRQKRANQAAASDGAPTLRSADDNGTIFSSNHDGPEASSLVVICDKTGKESRSESCLHSSYSNNHSKTITSSQTTFQNQEIRSPRPTARLGDPSSNNNQDQQRDNKRAHQADANISFCNRRIARYSCNGDVVGTGDKKSRDTKHQQQQMAMKVSNGNDPNQNPNRGPEKRLKLNSLKAGQNFPFWRHTYLHFHRSWLSIVRDPMLCWMQLALHILVPVMVSLVYGSQVGIPNACPRAGPVDIIAYALEPQDSALQLQEDLRRTLENIGYIFFKLYGIIFAAMTVTVLTFPLDMHVLVKEFRNGWYGLSSYFIGRTLADVPFQLTLPLLAMALSYYATGQPYSYMQWRFLSITAILILSSLIAQSQGLLFGAILMDKMKAAVFVAPAATTPIILFAGFLVRTQSIPGYLRPLSNLSYLRYAIEACLISRYGFNQCECDPSIFNKTVPELPPMARSMIDYWLSSFKPQVGDELVNSTTLAPQTGETPDLFAKLMDSLARANSFGRNITSCDQVVPYPMIDYDLKDSQLFYCFAILTSMLIVTRLLTFFIVSFKVKRKV